MRRAPFVRSFAYTECPLTGETEIEREANGGVAGCVWRVWVGGWVGGVEGAGTEIERKERRMNEPQCFFCFRVEEERVRKGREQRAETPRPTSQWGVMVASEGQCRH